MLYLAGIVYAVIFMAVGWRRPAIPLMLIFALAPFQNDVNAMFAQQNPDDPSSGSGGGLHFSIAEINLMLAMILFLLRRRPFLFGPILVPTLVYLAVCACSGLLNWHSSFVTSMVQMVLYLIISVLIFTSLGRDVADYQLAFNGLLVVCTVLAVAVLATRSGYVFGLHKNGVGGSLSCGVIICMELWLAATNRRRRMLLSWVLAILSAGLVFTLSRGGWIGAGTGIILILVMRRQFRMLVKVLIAFVPVVALCWHFLPAQSRQYATGLGNDNWNIKLRYDSIHYAETLFEENPILGAGTGLRKEYDATNLFWLVLAETGALGLLTFAAMQLSFLRMVWKTQMRLHRSEPLYSAVAIGGALVLGGLVHGLVDHYWSRGSISVSWAGAGMATYGYLVVQHRTALARAARRQALHLPTVQAA